ncbi:unnamed protein product, partial [Nesidiocoris tenuis]
MVQDAREIMQGGRWERHLRSVLRYLGLNNSISTRTEEFPFANSSLPNPQRASTSYITQFFQTKSS